MANPQTETSTGTAPAKAGPRYIWITNNEERLREIVLRGSVNDVSKTSSPGARFVLIPGANVVDAKLWTRWKSENQDREVEGERVHGHVTILLKTNIPRAAHRNRSPERAGSPYIVEGPRTNSPGDKAPLSDLDEQVAINVVGDILDEPMLKRLIGIERRSAVAEAIRARLDEFARADREAV